MKAHKTESHRYAFLLFAALLVFWPASGQAQTNPPADESPSAEGTRGLNLSEEQRNQIEGIRQDQQQKIQDVRNDSSLSQEQKREQAQQIQKDTRTQRAAVFTGEQREKLQQRRQNRVENGGHRPPRKRGNGPGANRRGGGRRG